MSITRHLAEMMLVEHRRRPIEGEVLLLGRQTVWMTIKEAEALVERVGLKIRAESFREVSAIPNQFGRELISDSSFFSLFSDADVLACDVSGREQADIIFDLGHQVPANMLGRFDFIYNGSVLDNVFDPAACIRNLARMLKPNGVTFGYEGISHFSAAYLKFSPDWFFDFFAINGFADCQVYVATYEDVHLSSFDMYEWSAFTQDGLAGTPKTKTDALVAVWAENSPSATCDRIPIQGVYRDGEHEVYQAAFSRFIESPRRNHLRSHFPPVAPAKARGWRALLGRPVEDQRPDIADGYRYLGRLGLNVFLGDLGPDS